MSMTVYRTKLADAERIAGELLALLQPHCTRMDVAGSIRRKVPNVGDVEILCEPIVLEEKDLFGNVVGYVRSSGWVNTVDNLGVRLKGNLVNGRYLQIMLSDVVKLDLFVPAPADYFRQLLIRTGSVEYVRHVAYNWKVKGWCGTHDGLRLQRDCREITDGSGKAKYMCVNAHAQLPPVWSSEEDFVNWLGLPYVQPLYRN